MKKMLNNQGPRCAAVALLCMFSLISCGGGGGGSTPAPTPVPAPPAPPPVVSGDFGAELLSTVASSGVAGTWGYTAADGGQYGLMGTAAGILVVDLRDPAKPRVVEEVAGPTDTNGTGIYWREMRVYGTHAYIVSEQTDVRAGVMILDLSGLPNTVRYVRSITPHDGDLSAHTIDIDTVRGLMYLQRSGNGVAPAVAPGAPGPGRISSGPMRRADEQHADPEHAAAQGSIEIWDLAADPENPRYLSTFNSNRNVHDMTAVGDYCYVAEGRANSFSIWDVKDPAAPTLHVRWKVEHGNYAHNIWPSGDASFVVTTEEIPTGLPARVWKLNGSAAPTLLSSFKVGNGTPHNVVMEGNVAYLSHYTEGALVVDLNDPAAPNVIARLDTSPLTGPSYNGCWGVYKFPNSSQLLCSDMETGMHVIRITAPLK